MSAASSDISQGPGEPSVSRLTIQSELSFETIDLSFMWQHISIYEDLFKNCVSGELTIIDGLGILHQLPILGMEFLVIEFGIPGEDQLRFTGRVTSVKAQAKLSDTKQAYVLHFSSHEMSLSTETRIGKTYKRMLFSDMVTSICDEYLDVTPTVEPSKFVSDLLVPLHWNVMRTLNYIARHCKSKTYNGANYVFFETLRDGFQFKSIESMVDPILVDSKGTFKRSISNVLNESGEESDGDFFMVEDFEAIGGFGGFSRLDLLSGGKPGLSSDEASIELVQHDLTERLLTKSQFDYLDTFDDYAHLELNDDRGQPSAFPTSSVFTGETPAHTTIAPKHTGNFTPGEDSTHLDEILLVRASQLSQLNMIGVRFEVPGNPTLAVGDVINLEIPVVETITADDFGDAPPPDPVYSGRHLVVQIRHMMTPARYVSIIETAKDSTKLFSALQNEEIGNRGTLSELSKG